MANKHEFESLVYHLKAHLTLDGFDIRERVIVQWTNDVRALGRCCNLSPDVASLYFSETLLDIYDTEDGFEACRNVIFHELIHAMKSSGTGHGPKFQFIAGKINRKYSAHVTSRCVGADCDVWVKANLAAKRYKYHIYCACGNVDTYKTRACKRSKHPDLYYCPKCGGSLMVDDL